MRRRSSSANGLSPGQPRDTQRKRVYDWERVFIHPHCKGEQLTLPEIRALCDEIGEWLGCPRITVKDGRGRRSACGGGWMISMPRWSRNRSIVLHEIVHCLVPYGYAWHGPEFVRVFIELLHRYLKIPKAELRETLRKAHVKVGPVAVWEKVRTRWKKKPPFPGKVAA